MELLCRPSKFQTFSVRFVTFPRSIINYQALGNRKFNSDALNSFKNRTNLFKNL